MRVVTAEDIDRALPWHLLIAELRRAFAGGVTAPERHHHEIAGDDCAEATLLLMPAWDADFIGIKSVTIHPGNAIANEPSVNGAYLLSRRSTGKVLAMIDAHALTARRTAGVAALAADLLARPEASRLLVVGSGAIAGLVPEAVAAVRPIAEVAVWSRRPASAQALCGRLQERGLSSEVAVSLEAAARDADVVSCATMSREPLIAGRWLRPGAHLDLIGSFRPDMEECDADCFAGSQVFADSTGALDEAGELVAAQAAGTFDRGDLAGTLAQLCAGSVRRDCDRARRTVFKSVGCALADFAAATALWLTLEQGER